MTFRTNFLLQCVTTVSWTLMNVGFYIVVFDNMQVAGQDISIGVDTGWDRNHFFIFLATTWFINSMVQTFFMPNALEFSEMIRTGNLDFALLKPIDTQFLISFRKIDWASLSNFAMAVGLLTYALGQLLTNDSGFSLHWVTVLLYPLYIMVGVSIMYSLMLVLSSTSVWLGRNQTLSNFWFYITNFSRYPMEIYNQGWGTPLYLLFTFIIPVLVVVNVPARLLAQPLTPRAWWEWPLAGFALFAAIASLLVSRFIFKLALGSYRSASS
ncbi:MAG: ABC-2 family transporter protein [bacterium]|nr:ABC-2 family transporter protein [bacterium]